MSPSLFLLSFLFFALPISAIPASSVSTTLGPSASILRSSTATTTSSEVSTPVTVAWWPWVTELGHSREDDSIMPIPIALQQLFGMSPLGGDPPPTLTQSQMQLATTALAQHEHGVSMPAPSPTLSPAPSPTATPKEQQSTWLSKNKIMIIGAVIGVIFGLLLLSALMRCVHEYRWNFNFKTIMRDRNGTRRRVASVFSHESWGTRAGKTSPSWGTWTGKTGGGMDGESDEKPQESTTPYPFAIRRNPPGVYRPVVLQFDQSPIASATSLENYPTNHRSTMASNKLSTFASVKGDRSTFHSAKRSTLASVKMRLSRLLSSSTFALPDHHDRDTITTQDTQSIDGSPLRDPRVRDTVTHQHGTNPFSQSSVTPFMLAYPIPVYDSSPSACVHGHVEDGEGRRYVALRQGLNALINQRPQQALPQIQCSTGANGTAAAAQVLTGIISNAPPPSLTTHHGRTKSAPVLSQAFPTLRLHAHTQSQYQARVDRDRPKSSKSVRFSEEVWDDTGSLHTTRSQNHTRSISQNARWDEEIARASDGSRYDIISAYARPGSGPGYGNLREEESHASPYNFGVRRGPGDTVYGGGAYVSAASKENLDVIKRETNLSVDSRGTSRVSQYGYQW
ncbi:hypothetical protein BJ138DRAFT_1150637 [Hygrophoropsis aurantiaca]|uniref:Uncharacterized protein n=1 Tax=Hygrophoropsis aurantiaca TaxID=72124 RepID=A0ACB8ADH4_9AGAM|nr:hypothetical protein BJ138DRAFT_1150637 [Hygrophoropsis aurantiaca]